MKRTKIIGFLLTALVLSGMLFVPESIGLHKTGIRTLGVLTAVIIALVTEILPIGITCILGIALCVIFGAVPDISGALSGFTNHVLFFTLVSFGISEAIATVPLSNRILALLIKFFGVKSKNLLFAVMVCAAALSSIMSNVATTAVLITVILSFLKVYDNPEERRQSGKSFMIGLPIASMIGGMMTPAGSPLNLLALGFLEDAGIYVSFVQWMIIAAPITVIALVMAWIIISRVFEPAQISREKAREYIDSLQIPPYFDHKERCVCVIMAGMIILWVLSSWFPVLNITVVGTVGFGLLFFPGIEVLTWEEYVKHVSWASYFLIGSMMTFGNALNQSGVSEWIIHMLFSGKTPVSVSLIVLMICLLVFILLIPIPIGPALISILGLPFITLAQSWGISPVILLMPLVLCASNCYLLPLDTVPLLTYATGYYKIADMPKVSIAIQLLTAVLITIWIPFSVGFLHL